MSDESFYVDTSALAKWYLNEENSDKFATWIQKIDRPVISELTETEMRCLLARRRRMKQLDRESELKIFATFQNDIAAGHLMRPAMETGCFEHAVHLIDYLSNIPLRTLDALHLAVAQKTNIENIATADTVFAEAAEELHFRVIKF